MIRRTTVTGITYIGIAYLIFDTAGNVVGGVVTAESVERPEELRQVVATLTDNISVMMASTTEEVAAVSSKLTDVAKDSQR